MQHVSFEQQLSAFAVYILQKLYFSLMRLDNVFLEKLLVGWLGFRNNFLFSLLHLSMFCHVSCLFITNAKTNNDAAWPLVLCYFSHTEKKKRIFSVLFLSYLRLWKCALFLVEHIFFLFFFCALFLFYFFLSVCKLKL